MTLLPRSTPSAQGLDPAAVRQLVASLDALHEPDVGPGGPTHHVHSFVLVRNGAVVGEGSWTPCSAERPHMLFSVSKSFTSTAVGLAIDEGRFGLDDRVVDLLAEYAPAQPSANLAAMTVRHLLTMTGGYDQDTLDSVDAGGDWVRKILALPVQHEPGTHWLYNTGGTYLLGAIVARRTGQRLLDYLRPRLFEPLGIATATWEQDPDGLDTGGFGLSITVEELAAFGQLCLQRGRWHDRQIVAAAWIDAATAKQMDNAGNDLSAAIDSQQGYGFQFWRCRHGAYRGDGMFGQFVIVWPEHQIVLAINSGTSDMQAVLDAVWSALLPSLSQATAPVDQGGVDTSWLRLPIPAGAPTSPREASVLDRAHAVGEISRPASEPAERRAPGEPRLDLRSITLGRDDDGRLALRLDLAGRQQQVVLGYREWMPGSADLGSGPTEIASAAAWVDDSTLVAHIHNLGTPYTLIVTLRLARNHIDLTLDQNVSFGPTHLLDAVATPPA